MFIATIALSLFLAVGFLYYGALKVTARPEAVTTANRLHIDLRLMRVIGLLEMSAAGGLSIGLYWAPLGVAAAIGLILLLTGATATHVRVKDPIPVAAVPVTLALVSAATLVLRLATT